MMTFVKLLDEAHIESCPKQGVSHGRIHSNLSRYYGKNTDLASEDGYYELVTEDKPEGWYEPRYTLDGLKIYQSWVESVPTEPAVDPIAEQLEEMASIVDYNLMMGTLADPSEMED